MRVNEPLMYKEAKRFHPGFGVAMNLRLTLLAGLGAVAFSASAHAQSFCYGSSCGTNSAIVLNGGVAGGGSASATSSTITLESDAANSYGSVASANTFATAGQNFSTSFNFQINTTADCVNNAPSGCSKGNANGFAFVLTTAPGTDGVNAANGGSGSGHLSIGQGAGTSVDVVFGTYGGNALAPNGSYNYVGIATDGNNNFANNPNVGNVYGTGSCAGGGSKSPSVVGTAGCMANGDVWTVSIALINNLLTVTLKDTAEANSSTPISLTYNLASYFGNQPVYLGFASSTGTSYEQIKISNWSASESAPEPASIAALGVGLAGLGFIRRRKQNG